MSKVVVDRLVLETEGAVSHDLAELFRQVADCFSLQLLIVIVLCRMTSLNSSDRLLTALVYSY